MTLPAATAAPTNSQTPTRLSRHSHSPTYLSPLLSLPMAATRKKLQREFRLRGFTLKVDALEEAAAFLACFPDAEDDALDLLGELDKEPRTSRLLIHGEARDKATLYRDRYQVLLQRLARDKYFSKPAFDTVMTKDDNFEITSIQSLIGCTGRRWIMGVISQLKEHQFYLEDLTGAVTIDLSNAIS